MGNSAATFFAVIRAFAIAILMSIAVATQADVTLKAEPGLAGTYVSGTWTPMHILAENMPDPDKPGDKPRDVTGTLRVKVIANDGQAIEYSHPLELPAQSRKLIEMPVILPDNSIPISIMMKDTKNRTVAETKLTLGKNSGADQRLGGGVVPTVLIEQDPNRSIDYPAWGSEAANVQRLPLGALPSDAKSYAGVRTLVIRSRLSNVLSEEQWVALESWIEFGGMLIVVGAHAPGELKIDERLIKLMPATPDFTREVRLEELVRESGPDSVLLVEWKDRHESAETLVDSLAGPLALRRRIGRGSVIAVGIDPSGLSKESLEKSPVGLAIQTIFDAGIMSPVVEDLRARHVWSTNDVAANFDVDLLPNRSVITLVIIAFVLIVGPLNFNYLRRIRRLELAWVTIPGLSILFFMAVYGFGVLTKGNRQFWASAEILHLHAGQSRGLLLLSATQFSPSSRNYHMTPPVDGTILPLSRYYDPPSAGGLSMLNMTAITSDPNDPSFAMLTSKGGYDLISPGAQWSAHFYQGERPMEIEGTIDGSVTLLAEKEALIEIVNNTKEPLLSATVYVGDQPVVIGDIAAGERWSSRQNLKSARVAESRINTEEWYQDPDRERQQLAYDEQALHGEYNDAPRPSSPFRDAFEQSAFLKVSLGSHALYPVQPLLHPQRRARLIARQSAWQSEVKISPEPDDSRIAGMVEVALPMRVSGKVAMDSLHGNSVKRLRTEVVDFDRTNTSFYNQAGQICSLNESFVEVVVSPPALTGDVKFDSGTLEIRASGPASFLLVRAFNFTTGKWDVAYQDIQTQSNMDKSYPVPGGHRIPPDWVNPIGHYVRVRIDSREPPKTATQKAGMNLNFGGSGIELISVGGTMTFIGSEPPQKIASTQGQETDNPNTPQEEEGTP